MKKFRQIFKKKKNNQNNIKHICGIFNFEDQKFSSTFIDKKSNNFQQNLKNRQFLWSQSTSSSSHFINCFKSAKLYSPKVSENIASIFPSECFKLLRIFEKNFDLNFLLYPKSNKWNDDYLSTFDYFLSIKKSIPFISKQEDDLKTLYFDLCQIKEFVMSELINNRSCGEISEIRHLIKKAYNKLNSNCSKVCYFMLKVVCFPVSEVIVESWGSVIDEIVKSKKRFKQQVDSESTDNTEKLCFIRLNGPKSGKINIRKLFDVYWYFYLYSYLLFHFILYLIDNACIL